MVTAGEVVATAGVGGAGNAIEVAQRGADTTQGVAAVGSQGCPLASADTGGTTGSIGSTGVPRRSPRAVASGAVLTVEVAVAVELVA